jgi:hypothetical protein
VAVNVQLPPGAKVMLPVSEHPLVGGLDREKSPALFSSTTAGIDIGNVLGLMLVNVIFKVALVPTFVGGKITEDWLGIVIFLMELFNASAR